MENKAYNNKIRHYKAYMSSYNINMIHRINPWVPAWWSAAFPGLGHLILGMYLKGFILFICECIINLAANLNLAILYSFIGEFDLAKETVNTNWLLLYMPFYIFSSWDSYRIAVENNKLVGLTESNKTRVTPFMLSPLSLNFIDKRNPINAIFFSFFTPGLGHLYANRIPTGIFLLICSVVTINLSNTLPAVHYTFLGEFERATSILDFKWFLFLPSVYVFAIYDSYRIVVETNKLFNEEQTLFFEENYQDPDYKMPI